MTTVKLHEYGPRSVLLALDNRAANDGAPTSPRRPGSGEHRIDIGYERAPVVAGRGRVVLDNAMASKLEIARMLSGVTVSKLSAATGLTETIVRKKVDPKHVQHQFNAGQMLDIFERLGIDLFSAVRSLRVWKG